MARILIAQGHFVYGAVRNPDGATDLQAAELRALGGDRSEWRVAVAGRDESVLGLDGAERSAVEVADHGDDFIIGRLTPSAGRRRLSTTTPTSTC